MADLANVVVKGEFDGQELIAGLKEVSKLGKKAATDSDLLNKAMGKLSGAMDLVSGNVKNAIDVLSRGFDTLGNKIDNQKQSFDRLATSIKNVSKETTTFNKVQKQAAGMVDKMFGNTSRGAAQANRFNSANFLAQFQDIAVTSAMGMNPMLIAVQQGTQLQYILAQSNAPLKDFVAGLKSMFSVVGLLTIGLTGIIAALIQLVDWTKVAQTILSGFASAFAWLGDKLNLDFLTNMGEYFRELADDIGLAKAALESWNNVLLKFDMETENIEFQRSIEGLTTYEREYKKAFRELQIAFSKEKSRLMAEGGTDEDVARLEREISLIPQRAKERAEQIVLTEKATEARKKEEKAIKDAARASEVDAKSVKKLAEAWDKLNVSAQNKVDDLLMQKNLIGAGVYEKTYVQTLNDLKRQAESTGIDLYAEGSDGKTKFQELQNFSEGIAQQAEEVQNLTDKYDFAKSTVKGFFSDMRQGLRDGESAWESFGNAINNVLDRILDKIMDIGVDALFNAGRSAGWFTGGQQAYSSPIRPTMPGATPLTGNALGGVWDNGVQKFARGGIVSSPTVFGMRRGLGMMGEAGPEAIMPLTRGPDGSLGVRADNDNSSPVIVNVINNSNAQAKVEQRQTSQGMEIDVMIDQLVAEKMNQPGTSSNTALRAFNNQKLIAR